jgi:hypothetical protein
VLAIADGAILNVQCLEKEMVLASRGNSILEIDDDLLGRIFLYLPEASDRESCGCVNRQWLRVSRAEHDGGWAHFCWKDLHLRRPTGVSSPGLVRE